MKKDARNTGERSRNEVGRPSNRHLDAVGRPEGRPTFELGSTNSATNSPQSQITAALNEYTAALEDGDAPNREEFLSRFPYVRDELRASLEGLEFIHLAGRRVVDESADGTPLRPILEPGLGQLGDFRLLRELGRGGMGIVYEAEQLSLGRRVALKILPFAAMLDPTRLQRFHLEAHAAASLDHTHIVPVYFVGQDRGVHYYAMRLIEGQSLAEIIALSRRGQAVPADTGSPSAPPVHSDADTQPVAALTTLTAQRSHDAPTFFRSVARLGIQAAEALEHAHRMGMVHRDIKPSNLLVSSDARLWVTDFGLAQVPDATDLTLTGDLIGTLRYMSPEQASGQASLTDHRTDIYSLGATL